MLGGVSLSRAALSLTLAIGSLSSFAHGLFPDEAGRIDWHRAQIGRPTKIVPYAFNETDTGLFAITDRNTLASLSPASGEIVWRQMFGPDETIKALRVRDGRALTLSGANETQVRVWDAVSGSLVWGFSQPPDANYRKGSGAAEFVEGSEDVVAVVGDSLVRLTPGATVPVWEVPLNATAAYKRVVLEDKSVFVVGDARLTKKNPKPRMQVVEVDLKTGGVKQKYQFASGQAVRSNRVVFLQSREYGSYVVWRDEKNIVWFVHRLGMSDPEWEIYHAKLVQVELMPADMLTSTLYEIDSDPALNANHPRFVMTYLKDDKIKTIVVEMYRSGDKLEMRKVAGFRSDDAVVAGCGIAAAKKDAANPNAPRAVVSVRSSDNVSWRVYTDSKTPTHTGDFAYSKDTYGPVKSATLYHVGGEPRVLVQTSGGLVAALAPGSSEPVWFRDESLSHATDMAFLELPPPVSSAEYAAKATDPSVLGSPVTRYILRWAETVKSIVSWVTSGFGFFAPSSADAVGASGQAARTVAEELAPGSPIVAGDHFGFRKLSVFGTSTGVVAALSTQGGSRSWTRFLADNGTAVDIENVFVTRRNQPMSSSAPLVTVVGRSRASGNTVVAVLNALTGEFADGSELAVLPYSHAKVFELPAVDTLSNQQLVGLVYRDPENQTRLGIWPSTASAAKAFCAVAEPVFFDLNDGAGSTDLRGFRVECPADEAELDSWTEGSSGFVGREQWRFDLPAGETLVSTTGYGGAQSTALLGRVLGDRSVLYKYLNPHLITLATRVGKAESSSHGIGIYMVDRVTGSLLYSTVHANAHVTAKQPFLAIQSENRVIYQFWQEGSPAAAGSTGHSDAVRGYVTVVADLYESDKPDTRDESRAFSSYDLLLPHVITEAFVAPEAASALGVTRTGSNISTRDVVFGLASGKLLSLPDQMFDARRPKRAATKDEQAEGLVPYAAPLALDPKRVLSHCNAVAGIRQIRAAPTHLESTSLVAAYGLDLFFTRTSPSGTFDQLSPSFSKVNLVVTTLALAVGCLLGGPMVRRKLTNQAWA
ncbi:hypothetical protein GGI15_002445 [Coemansia interrupta]|uniref:ER membrane protein complex subunit 1 n=1 Tax=Coemansia interrupta TaxID=1126814 RepID=A0A9W8HI14_9FUNG|nr:hypothetical protein GGI15_002445 [Coemansia interrupta]